MLHVSVMSTNFLSVHQLTKDNNCYIVFDADKFFTQDNKTSKVTAQGFSSNGVYPLPNISSPHTSSVALHTCRKESMVWHNRLGHPNFRTLQSILSSLHVSSNMSSSYNNYHLAKSHKLPLPSSLTVTTKPLEIIYADVWGPSSTSTFLVIATTYYWWMIFPDFLGFI